jgi:two-component system, chemotaxis family, sensor kinase CheA
MNAQPVSAAAAFAEDIEMLAGFVTEAGEHLAAIEEHMLAIERDPALLDSVHAVFRAFHTLKGLACFLGLAGVGSVAHEVETLLDHARNGRIAIDAAMVDVVLESADYLRGETARVAARLDGAPPAAESGNAELLGKVRALTAAALLAAALAGDACAEPAQAAPAPAEAPEREAGLPAAVAGRKPAGCPEVAAGSIRIETMKLDQLMDLVGELVIAQAVMNHNPYIRSRKDVRLGGDISKLERITGEVQRCAMSLRMMPIGPLFQKNAKLVRELARQQGKQVELVLAGESTELDKSIAEELADPLLHMIRNAVDHGIETPEERLRLGKPATATLRLAAEHVAGEVVITIADDGRGLDPERILRKAVEQGLVEAGAQPARDEILQLIFAPGFSTAETLTELSGRGVGMDVVRKHVACLRGHIEIHSEPGRGTAFRIYLPLTLAILDALVTAVGSHRYLLPLFSVREMLRPTAAMLATVKGRDELVVVHERLLPLIRLHRRFNLEPRSRDLTQGVLVVCEAAGKRFCLFVDELVGRQEIVAKSCGHAFAPTPAISGCAILGDGQVGLILDVAGVYRMPDGPRGAGAA